MNNKNILLAFIAFFLVSASIFGQTKTNKEALLELSRKMSNEFQSKKAVAIEFAKTNNLPITFENDKGIFFELQYIAEGGIPMYYKTDNRNAAKTISTDKVYSNGGFGLNLDGTGITPREWDGGGIRLTHQEFGGRVTQVDNPSSTHSHSTHVAGTIIAAGVQPAAKGMAYNANLRAFDWNDDNSEMASEAANGALMSNHSYGFSRGWTWTSSGWSWSGNSSISTEEDYLFGFYDSESKQWDQISHNAPYYLIVKSAGNDRNEGPSNGQYPKDGPYDCIAHGGISKNVLTVGAVNDLTNGWTSPSSVIMSSFSSWGPADDGRVKPDIVANGVGLYSTDNTSNTAYYSSDGTSMSAPSATGSLALLQQHWENLVGSGEYMRSATLKGLVIHTADEAGSYDGPDYRFGWGLMNTKNAALKISENQEVNVINELLLSQGGSYEMIVTTDGSEDLKVTISWTDLPGQPTSPQLDPSDIMLVNDLDVRIVKDNVTYFPWKLDRDNPTAAATNNSKNYVDNVEVVWIENAEAGDYRVIVDHDGDLSGGSQEFSIIIGGVTATTSFPSVFAGDDTQTCENTDIQLEGIVSYTSSTLWKTSGDGSFENPTSLATIYVPGTNDIETGTVELSLTGYAIAPLNDSVIDNITVTIINNPFADAGDDITISGTEPAQLDGVADNFNVTLWTTRGDGTFDDPSLLNAVYTPGSGDISNGMVRITLLATAIEPCGNNATDELYIYFGDAPIANAGDDDFICGNNNYQLDGYADNYSTIEWSTSGDGSFDDNTILNPIYTPGSNDITTGNATLSLTAFDEESTSLQVTDDMILSIFDMPIINAGDDAITCENVSVEIIATVENQSSVEWSTSGDGTFADASELSTTYTPGANDLETGEAILTLTAYFDEGCPMGSDNLILTVQPNTTAYAGENDTACKDGNYTLAGVAQYNSTILWTTNGDGTFSDATLITSDYYPGTEDYNIGTVTLTLTAYPIEGCSVEGTDEVNLEIIDCSSIHENTSGNIDFSIIPNPANGTFTISTDEFKGNSAVVTIMSIDGSVVYKNNHNSVNNNLEININGESFANGIYTVIINSDKFSGVSKLIIRN